MTEVADSTAFVVEGSPDSSTLERSLSRFEGFLCVVVFFAWLCKLYRLPGTSGSDVLNFDTSNPLPSSQSCLGLFGLVTFAKLL